MTESALRNFTTLGLCALALVACDNGMKHPVSGESLAPEPEASSVAPELPGSDVERPAASNGSKSAVAHRAGLSDVPSAGLGTLPSAGSFEVIEPDLPDPAEPREPEFLIARGEGFELRYAAVALRARDAQLRALWRRDPARGLTRRADAGRTQLFALFGPGIDFLQKSGDDGTTYALLRLAEAPPIPEAARWLELEELLEFDATLSARADRVALVDGGVQRTADQIVFRRDDGEVAFGIPAPAAFDGGRGDFPWMEQEIEVLEPGRALLRTRLDADWLRSDRREWPVMIDPSVTTGAPPPVFGAYQLAAAAPGGQRAVINATYTNFFLDPLEVSLDWGDGQTEREVRRGPISRIHDYAQPGVYRLAIQVCDFSAVPRCTRAESFVPAGSLSCDALDDACERWRYSFATGSCHRETQDGAGCEECSASAECLSGEACVNQRCVVDCNLADARPCDDGLGCHGDGTCQDVDECLAGTATCDANAVCTNQHGSFECACAPGFEGDGFSCEAVPSVCDDATCINGTCDDSVGFTWAAAEGFGPDSNGDGLIDFVPLEAGAAAVSPPARVDFVCDTAISGEANVQWYVDGEPMTLQGVSPGQACPGWAMFETERDYEVTLALRDAAGLWQSHTQTVRVEDIVILAMGDSYGSGEGIPERPIESALFEKWLQADEDLQAAEAALAEREAEADEAEDEVSDAFLAGDPLGTLETLRRVAAAAAERVQSALTEVVRSAAEAREAARAFREGAVWQPEPPDDPTLDVTREACHRSSKGSQARAALLLEQADPHSRVSFVQTSCSGAKLTDLTAPGDQLDLAMAVLVDREVDLLLLSAGGNDFRFVDVIGACVSQAACHEGADAAADAAESQGASCANLGPLSALCGAGLSDNSSLDGPTLMAQATAELESTLLPPFADALEAWRPGLPVVQTAYPIPTRGDDGEICPSDSAPGFSAEETAWIDGVFGPTLNATLAAAATARGWTFVDGHLPGFAPHGFCATEPWLVGFRETMLLQGTPYGAMHPNAPGAAHFGEALFDSARALVLNPPATDAFRCSCEGGFEGPGCVTSSTDDCAAGACQNGASCTDGPGRPLCQCAPGFTGQRCEFNIDDCESRPCLNASACVDGANSFTCDCPAGFGGALCADAVDPCLADNCAAGATCTTGGGFTWAMAPRFGPDADCDGLVDFVPLEPGAAEVGGYEVRFDCTGPAASRSDYAWYIDGAPVALSPTNPDDPCDGSVLLPEARAYDVWLVTRDAAGDVHSQNQRVVLRDILIVGLGDSSMSGEGQPELPIDNVLFEAYADADTAAADAEADADAAEEAGILDQLADAFESAAETAGALASARADFEAGARWQPEPDASREICHRSSHAAPARAALALENADPHSVVTFVQLACSGGTTEDLTAPGGQIDLALSVIGDREVDLVTLATGGNDLDVRDIFNICIKQRDCHLGGPPDPDAEAHIAAGCADVGPLTEDCEESQAVTSGSDALSVFEAARATLTGDLLPRLAERLAEIPGVDRNSGAVHVLPYAFLVHDDNGEPCAGATVPPGLTPQELGWFDVEVLGAARTALADASAANGWSYLAGSEDATFTHGICAQDSWVVQLRESLFGQGDERGALHMNAEGTAHQGALLGDALVAGDAPAAIADHGAYTCACPAGSEGAGCSQAVTNGCAASPCLNGGSCTDRLSGFACDCAAGFRGERCEEVIVTTDPFTADYQPDPRPVSGMRRLFTLWDADNLDAAAQARIYAEDPRSIFVTLHSGGVTQLDISDAAAPAVIDRWQSEAEVHGQDRRGDLLVVTGRAGQLYLFDLSAGLEPVQTLDLGSELQDVRLHDADGRRYALVTAPVTGELIAVDVSDPLAPIQVAALELPATESVVVHGNHAFVAGADSYVAVDVTKVAAMHVVNELSDGAYLQMTGELAPFMPDQLFAAAGGNPGGLAIFDVSDPAALAETAALLREDMATANQARVSDEFVVQSLGQDAGGLAIVDVSLPDRPELVALVRDIGGSAMPQALASSDDHVYLFGGAQSNVIVYQLLRRAPRESAARFSFLESDDVASWDPVRSANRGSAHLRLRNPAHASALSIENVDGLSALRVDPSAGWTDGGLELDIGLHDHFAGRVMAWTFVIDLRLDAFALNGCNSTLLAACDDVPLLQFDASNQSDADLFLKSGATLLSENGYIGDAHSADGYGEGLLPETWHRVAVVFDLTAEAERLRLYVDGAQVRSADAEQAHLLTRVKPVFHLLADDDGEFDTPLSIAGFAFVNEALDAAEVAALGPADGLPLTDFDGSCSDQDFDGICDDVDACPHYSGSLDPGTFGESDVDGDGVCDSEEVCTLIEAAAFDNLFLGPPEPLVVVPHPSGDGAEAAAGGRHFAWTVNDVPVHDSSRSLPARFFDHGDTVTVQIFGGIDETGGPCIQTLSTVAFIGPPPAPSCDAVTLGPGTATTFDDLRCRCEGFSDPEGRPEDGSVCSFINQFGQIIFNSPHCVLPAQFHSAGDGIVCDYVASAGGELGPPHISNTVIIGNLAPSQPAVALAHDAPGGLTLGTADATLSCFADPATVSDPDGDDLSSKVEWTLNGAVALSEAGLAPTYTTTLPALHAALGFGTSPGKGDTVTCRVRLNDESGDGPWSEPALPLIVENSPPVVTAVSLDTASLDDAFTCTAEVENADGDPLTFDYVWDLRTADGLITRLVTANPTIPASPFRRGDALRCSVTVFDGDSSGSGESAFAQVVNRPPTATGLVATPETERYAGATLSCTPTGYEDLDLDEESWILEWVINGAVHSTEILGPGEGAELAGAFTTGDAVLCRVWPFDGTERGAEMVADLTIENHVPACNRASLSSTTPEAHEDIVCGCDNLVDIDGDVTELSCAWSLYDGTALPTEGCRLLAEDTVEGEAVRCTVSPVDPFTTGGSATRIAKIGEDNALSFDASVAITPGTVASSETDTTLLCEADADAVDIDASGVRYTVRWLVGSTERLSSTGTEPRGTATIADLAPSGRLSGGQKITCEITARDGFTAVKRSAEIRVQASPATLVEITTTPADRSVYPGETFSCRAKIDDPDNNRQVWVRIFDGLSGEQLRQGRGSSGSTVRTLSMEITEDTPALLECRVQTYESDTGWTDISEFDPDWGVRRLVSKSTPDGYGYLGRADEQSACEVVACRLLIGDDDFNRSVGGITHVIRVDAMVEWLVDGATVQTTQLEEIPVTQRSWSARVDDPLHPVVYAPAVAFPAGAEIGCRVTARKGDIVDSSVEPIGLTRTVAPGVPSVDSVRIPLQVRAGEPVECVVDATTQGCATDPGLAYRWRVDGAVVPGETESVFVSTDVDPGQAVQCEAFVTDGGVTVGTPGLSEPMVAGSHSWRILGDREDLFTGLSVAIAPDLSGDGRDEVVVGAPGEGERSGDDDTGAIYVFDGRDDGSDANIGLLGGSGRGVYDGLEGGWVPQDTFCAGLVLSSGSDCGERDPGEFNVSALGPLGEGLGVSVRVMEDLNGDGQVDIVGGAPYGRAGSQYMAGRVYVLPGQSDHDGTADEAFLTIRGQRGISQGPVSALGGDQAGFSIATGDFTGDGWPDIAIAAPRAFAPDGVRKGRVYIVSGRGEDNAFDLGDPDRDGFAIDASSLGNETFDVSAAWVDNAGDLNADGIDDLVIAPHQFVGDVVNFNNDIYVVYGRRSSETVDVDDPAAEGVFIFRPEDRGTDFSASHIEAVITGRRLWDMRPAGVGDVNGDGLEDFALPSYEHEDGAGQLEIAVFFARPGRREMDLARPDRGVGGFVIEGVPRDIVKDATRAFAAGDVNLDGLDDIGFTMTIRKNNRRQGRIYIAYGKADTQTLRLEAIENGSAGFVFNVQGEVSDLAAGDTDGDGLADLAVGMPELQDNTGRVQVFYGVDRSNTLTQRGGPASEVFTPGVGPEHIAAGLGDDRLVASGGADVLYAGGGDDVIEIVNGDFRRVDGGAGIDTLVPPAGVLFRLSSVQGRVRGIEALQLAEPDGGAVLTPDDMRRLSSSTNTLTVRGGATNLLQLVGGTWLPGPDEVIGSELFRVFESGAARVRAEPSLRVQVGPAVLTRRLEVAENTPPGTVLGDLGVIDPDGAVASVEVLSLNTPFDVLPGTDTLVVAAGGEIDREARDHWPIVIRAFDDDGLQSRVHVEIVVTDVNEPPVFPDPNPHLTIDEGFFPGQLVTTVQAVDEDLNERLFYQARSGNAGTFVLDNTTGELRLNKRVDFEATPHFELHIFVRDSVGHAANMTLSIDVNDTEVFVSERVLDFTSAPVAPFANEPDQAWQPVAHVEQHVVSETLGRDDGELDTPGIDAWTETDFTSTLDAGWASEASGGSATASLPVDLSFAHADELELGVPFELQSGWSLAEGAGFDSVSPLFSLLTDLGIDVRYRQHLIIDDQAAETSHLIFDAGVFSVVPGTDTPAPIRRRVDAPEQFQRGSVAFSERYPDGTTIDSDPLLELFTEQPGSTEHVDFPNLLMSESLVGQVLEIDDTIPQYIRKESPAVADVLYPDPKVVNAGALRLVADFDAIRGRIEASTIFTQAYFVDVEGLVMTLTLEDGSQIGPLTVGEAHALTLPAGADVNGDGDVRATARFELQARLYTRLRSRNFGDLDATYAHTRLALVDGAGNLLARKDTQAETETHGGFEEREESFATDVVMTFDAFELETVFDLVAVPRVEDCDNALDDDLDGAADCADPECDGQLCSNSHICEAGRCVDACGDCDDGIPCTNDGCFAPERRCVHRRDDSNCADNGNFCDGPEVCNRNLGCISQGNPCLASGQTCDAVTESCVGFLSTDASLIAATGDSLSRGFVAPCTDGSLGAALACVNNGDSGGVALGGDYPQYAWITGDDPDVGSMAVRVGVALGETPRFDANFAVTSSRWSDFEAQAAEICNLDPRPAEVSVLFGGNDVCASASVDALPDAATLLEDLRAGLDVLAGCVSHRTTVRVRSTPRADLLYEAGLGKQASACPGEQFINCERVWHVLDVCPVVTQEPDPVVRAQIGAVIDDWNQAIADEVARYDANVDGRNPRAVGFVSDWQGSIDEGFEGTSFGATRFGPCDLSAMDCFHPSIIGQRRLACVAFADHPLNPDPGGEDCSSPRLCGNGVLESDWGEQCEQHSDCASDEACDSLCACVPVTSISCAAAADCPDGYTCSDDACILPLPDYADFSAPGRAVLDTLAGGWPTERPTLWDLRRDTLPPANWLVQSPNTWGDASSVLDDPGRCSPGADPACDPDFLLRECFDDSDCGDQGRCQFVVSTVRSDIGTPKKLCAGHSMGLVDEMYLAMIEAQSWLDVTSLSPPDERFLVAFRKALSRISRRGGTPVQVRFLVSQVPGLEFDTDALRDDLLEEVPGLAPLTLHVGAYRAGASSWNHSKIIAADGRVLMTGGHNFYTSDYLLDAPVHDISLRLDGGIADSAHRFVDRLWPFLCQGAPFGSRAEISVRPATAPRCPPRWAATASLPDPTLATGRRAISVGRLGALGENPSEAAQVALMDAASSEIRLSLQDLGPFTIHGIPTSGWPEPVLGAIARAALRDVDVYIVLSSPGGHAGYHSGWSTSEVVRQVLGWADDNPDAVPAGVDAEEKICDRLRVAFLRAGPDDTWLDGAGVSNHAKLIYVDDAAVYVGSHNLYIANHAEHGVIIDDGATAAELRAEYLDPMWQHSARTAVSGAEVGGCNLAP